MRLGAWGEGAWAEGIRGGLRPFAFRPPNTRSPTGSCTSAPRERPLSAQRAHVRCQGRSEARRASPWKQAHTHSHSCFCLPARQGGRAHRIGHVTLRKHPYDAQVIHGIRLSAPLGIPRRRPAGADTAQKPRQGDVAQPLRVRAPRERAARLRARLTMLHVQLELFCARSKLFPVRLELFPARSRRLGARPRSPRARPPDPHDPRQQGSGTLPALSGAHSAGAAGGRPWPTAPTAESSRSGADSTGRRRRRRRGGSLHEQGRAGTQEPSV